MDCGGVGGDEGDRTLDLTDANRTLSQLSYAPIYHIVPSILPKKDIETIDTHGIHVILAQCFEDSNRVKKNLRRD